MMAKLKDRGMVLKRDDSFSARLDVERPAEQLQPVAKPTPKAPAKKLSETTASAQKPAEKPKELAPQPAFTAPIPAPDPETTPDAVTPAETPTNTLGVEELATEGRGKKVKLRVTFRCPSELTERASAWAEKARCPVSAVYRKAFGELRPQLIERIEAGIKYTEVPNERMTDASHPFDTSMMISQGAYDQLGKEIDPEAMTGIEGPMSRWARAQFLPHFDAWLTGKGQ